MIGMIEDCRVIEYSKRGIWNMRGFSEAAAAEEWFKKRSDQERSRTRTVWSGNSQVLHIVYKRNSEVISEWRHPEDYPESYWGKRGGLPAPVSP